VCSSDLFSALDPLTAQALYLEVERIKEEFALPVVLVSHDLDAALRLGDAVLALRAGRADDSWLARVIKVRSKPGGVW
jgi:molybdate transport system ATP-binding protein